MKKVRIPLKQRILDMLRDGRSEAAKHNGKANVGHYLCEIFFWQEIAKTAADNLKLAWANAQGESGPIDVDDDLRDHGAGEFIVCESEHFSCVVKVQEPRQNFDRDLFIQSLCRTYKLDRDAVEKMAKNCCTATRAPLSKQVLEAAN